MGMYNESFLQSYFFNIYLFLYGQMKILGCSYIGMWALFFWDDAGESIEKCLNIGAEGGLPVFFDLSE